MIKRNLLKKVKYIGFVVVFIVAVNRYDKQNKLINPESQ